MERLALDRFASPWLRNQHLARYRWSTSFARGLRVLDAASGTGYGSRLFAEAGARHVVSMDLSEEGDGIAFTRADVSRLPLKNGSIDVYACFETIEHVDDDRALLMEAKRVLGSGGTLLCSTPNRDLLSPGLTLADRPRNPHHLREYSIDEFGALLSEFFEKLELYGQTWFSEPHQKLLARAGAHSNLLSVRLHQISNIARLPWESESRHWPRPLTGASAPEVV
ncbi:MAG: methyltransferase domain-containing protein, partial [Vicinamibacteria bacterium]